MSDPCGALRAALTTVLEADAGVAAAFGATSVRCFYPAPTNVRKPYLVIGSVSTLPDRAECIDGAEVNAQIDVWSLTRPASFDEAEAIAQAVQAAAVTELTVPGFTVRTVEPVSTDYLTDPSDNATAHAVVRVRYFVEPAD